MAIYNPTIVGYETGGVWTGGPAQPTIHSSSTIWSALRFEIPVTTADGRPDLLLDPPIFRSLDFRILYIFPLLSPAGPEEMTVWLIDEPDPPEFDGVSNRPSDQVAAYGTREIATYATAGQPAGTWLEMEFDMLEITPVYRGPGWMGALNIVFHYVVLNAPATVTYFSGLGTAYEPQMISDQLPFITGISGPVDAWSRVDRCGKCGTLDVREHFSEDGYSKGLFVCTDCLDPEEPEPVEILPDLPPIND